MAYALDFVMNVMRELSSSEPVLFQRDELLYVASEQGFGQIPYGLDIRPKEGLPSWEKQPQEIKESEDILILKNKRLVFKKSEEPYLKAICFGPDDNTFSLEKIAKSAKELTKLKDDGMIRMVLHGSGYHGHKYGYGVDGTDVWVQRARVMNRNKYLELFGEKEDRFFSNIEHIKNISEMKGRKESYDRVIFPDCVILTPYIMVSLPRWGKLHIDRAEPDSWTQRTGLSINYDRSQGSILRHFSVSTCKESPFGISIKLNAQIIGDYNAQGLNLRSEEIIKRIEKEVSAVSSNIGFAEGFVDKLNSLHNEICAQDIEWQKRLRESCSKEGEIK